MATLTLCPACRSYQRNHGKPRPESLYRLPARVPNAMCSHCRLAPAARRCGLCETCYEYLQEYGKPRPRHYFARATRCRNCEAPRAAFVKPFSRKGYCGTCEGYRRENGRHRPAELIERAAPLGWCECGALAVTVRPFEIPLGKGHEMKYEEPLCARCERAEEAA